MILAFMLYSLAVGVLAALAAWLAEKALGSLGHARRTAWIAGICTALLMPLLAVFPQDPMPPVGALPAMPTGPDLVAAGFDVHPILARLGEARVGAWTLDHAAALAWTMLSTAALFLYGASAWRLSRRARRWHETRIEGRDVKVAPDVGPAVFGCMRPRVIFPSWLIAAPAKYQRLVLAHESQHAAARDPQILAAATVLGALFPWNAALWWMLRRLRFATEVDCDARVLRDGADAGSYGMALLYVSERQAPSPMAAIPLIERTSQLERRIDIMLASPRRFSALAAGLFLTLAGGCIVAAAAVDAPAISAAAATVLKPPPGTESMGFKLGQHFERHIQEKYPELMGGNFEGRPMIVVLMNDDWSIAKSAKTLNPDPEGDVHATSELFGLLGIAPADAPYVGAMNMQMAKDKFVVMVYTERSRPGERFVSKIFPDTRKQDRELFEQSFPGAGAVAVPAGQNPWLLLDRSGKVLRKGIEAVTPAWADTLESRFAGIETREMTVTSITDASGEPMRDAAGKEIHLHAVWLAPESAPPAN